MLLKQTFNLKKITLLAILMTPCFANAQEEGSLSGVETAKMMKGAVNNAISDGNIKLSEKKLELYNYVINENVVINDPYSLSIETGGQFVPQMDEFLEMYISNTQKGIRPIEAIILAHTSPVAIELIQKYGK